MTGPEHYREAERIVRHAQGQEIEAAAVTLADAQVHATLALAAATALNDAQGGMTIRERREWVAAAGTAKGGAR